jgi:hypothetical protein
LNALDLAIAYVLALRYPNEAKPNGLSFVARSDNEGEVGSPESVEVA